MIPFLSFFFFFFLLPCNSDSSINTDFCFTFFVSFLGYSTRTAILSLWASSLRGKRVRIFAHSRLLFRSVRGKFKSVEMVPRNERIAVENRVRERAESTGKNFPESNTETFLDKRIKHLKKSLIFFVCWEEVKKDIPKTVAVRERNKG